LNSNNTALADLDDAPAPLPARPIAANFRPFFTEAGEAIPAAKTVPLLWLMGLLERDHPAGAQFAVVSKRVATRGRCVTTVLDVPARKVYRAAHATGLVSLWKGVAKRRAHVQYVPANVAFTAATAS
jgi:hypothetical protein